LVAVAVAVMMMVLLQILMVVLAEVALDQLTLPEEPEHLDKEIMAVMRYILDPHIQQVEVVVRVRLAGITLVLRRVLVELDWQTQLLGLLLGNCQAGYII
jgi:hypothetical protein